MKIEMCEQMAQSWLLNCKNCQIAQTNWSISPSVDIEKFKPEIIAYIDYFVNVLKSGVSSGAISTEDIELTPEEYEEAYEEICEDTNEQISFLSFCQMYVSEMKALKENKNNDFDFSGITILGKSGKAKELQFVRQTEIDVLGIEIEDTKVKNIYFVDTAYHKSGLNYTDTLSTVIKKIVRAVLVSDLVFGTDAPVHIIFASPECKPGPLAKINAAVKFIEPHIPNRPTLPAGKPSNISVEVYLNKDFSDTMYVPLMDKIDILNNDNDLFMRSMNLAKSAQSKLPSATSTASKGSYRKKTAPSSSTPFVLSPSAKSIAAKYTDAEKIKVAEYYLSNDEGLVNVEKNHLGITGKKGSYAQAILNSIGVDTSGKYKGLLKKYSSIDDVIAATTDANLKDVLEKIKNP